MLKKRKCPKCQGVIVEGAYGYACSQENCDFYVPYSMDHFKIDEVQLEKLLNCQELPNGAHLTQEGYLLAKRDNYTCILCDKPLVVIGQTHKCLSHSSVNVQLQEEGHVIKRDLCKQKTTHQRHWNLKQDEEVSLSTYENIAVFTVRKEN